MFNMLMPQDEGPNPLNNCDRLAGRILAASQNMAEQRGDFLTALDAQAKLRGMWLDRLYGR